MTDRDRVLASWAEAGRPSAWPYAWCWLPKMSIALRLLAERVVESGHYPALHDSAIAVVTRLRDLGIHNPTEDHVAAIASAINADEVPLRKDRNNE